MVSLAKDGRVNCVSERPLSPAEIVVQSAQFGCDDGGDWGFSAVEVSASRWAGAGALGSIDLNAWRLVSAEQSSEKGRKIWVRRMRRQTVLESLGARPANKWNTERQG